MDRIDRTDPGTEPLNDHALREVMDAARGATDPTTVLGTSAGVLPFS